MLWLWRRPVATAPMQPLAWEPPYAAGAAKEKATITTKRQKNKKIKIKNKKKRKGKRTNKKKKNVKTARAFSGGSMG